MAVGGCSGSLVRSALGLLDDCGSQSLPLLLRSEAPNEFGFDAEDFWYGLLTWTLTEDDILALTVGLFIVRICDDPWDSSDLGSLCSVLLAFGSVLVVVWASRQEAHKHQDDVVLERPTNLAPQFVQCLMHRGISSSGEPRYFVENDSSFSPQCRQ